MSGCSFWNEEGWSLHPILCLVGPEGLLCGEDEGNDETVEAEHFREDEDEDHAHEEPGLLGSAPHACIAHNADGKAGCQPAQAHTQASAQLKETLVETDAFSQGVGDEDCQCYGSAVERSRLCDRGFADFPAYLSPWAWAQEGFVEPGAKKGIGSFDRRFLRSCGVQGTGPVRDLQRDLCPKLEK